LSGKAGSGPEGGSFAKIVIEQTGNVKKEIKKEAAEEAIEKILMIKLYDPEGKYKSSFCPPLDYNDMLMNAMGNGIFTALGPDSTVYVTFNYQNRIERYSADGELLFSADRPVNYEVTGPKKDKDDESTTEVKKSDVYVVYSLNMPGFNNVSRGIGVDSKGRAWVMTYAKQYDIENDDLPKLQIEVFDDKGVLLCVLPWEEDFIPATNALNIIGDLVFFFDTEGISVYEYRITESK